jgi:predicted amidohydrolase
MKDIVDVSLIQFAPGWLEQDKNRERMKSFAQQEAEKGAELIVFPELSNTGYITPTAPGTLPDYSPDVDAAEFATMFIKASEPIPGPTTNVLGEVAKKYGVYIVVGIAQLHPVIPYTLYNSAALIGPFGIIGVHHKVHLPYEEKQYFYPGNTVEVHATELGNIGMTVCYDGRFPELSRVLALKGAEIICSVWAVPKTAMEIISEVDSLKHRAYTRAQENGVYYLACNRSGRQGDTEFIGHSVVAAPNGKIIAYCDSSEELSLTAELNNEELIKYRARLSIFRDRRPELYTAIVEPLSQPFDPVPAKATSGAAPNIPVKQS